LLPPFPRLFQGQQIFDLRILGAGYRKVHVLIYSFKVYSL
jgi:hypothetical protein